jgi:hypothetical protein
VADGQNPVPPQSVAVARKELDRRREQLRTTLNSGQSASDTAPAVKKHAAAVDDAKTAVSTAWLRRAAWVLPACLFIVAGVAVVAGVLSAHGRYDPARVALLVAAPATAIALSLVGLFPGRNRGWLVGYLVGADNRLSTSKTQIGLWTAAVIFAFLFFIVQLARTSGTSTLTASINHFGPEYLLLLGGPFAAAVLATATTSSKVGDGTVQQVNAASPSPADLVTDQDGQPAIADAQFLLFNLVALGYFAVALARHPDTLPQIPTTLVALTSVSALTYLGAKVVAANAPAITTVLLTSPSDGKLHAGDTVKIIGSGFQPPATTPGTAPEHSSELAVTFDRIAVYPAHVSPDNLSDTAITAIVPPRLAGDANGNVSISILTAAGVQTSPFTGLSAAGTTIAGATRVAEVITLTGFGFLEPTVTVDNAPIGDHQLNVADSRHVQITLDKDPGRPVTVSVAVAGGAPAVAQTDV